MSPKRVLAGVALVSASVLVTQLTLTRLFSATMHYHFAFLAISLALLGSGAGGVLVHLLGQRLHPPARWLSIGAVLFGLSTVAALAVILRNPLWPLESRLVTLGRLTAIYAAAALPFLMAGAVVALAVTRYAPDMGRLYMFDLGGAAAGCLLVIPSLDAVGAVNTLLLASVMGWAAAALFQPLAAMDRRHGLLLGMSGGALLALTAANVATGGLDVRKAKGLIEEGSVLFAEWNSFSRVTVWGSLSDPAVHVMIDADATTLVLKDGGTHPERHRHLVDRVESLAYELKPGADVLIIGSGGGAEVVMARLFGARRITAVEVNPIIARDVMSREPYRGYSGAIYEQTGVRLVVDEARSFIRSTAGSYDVIQATMVDTWAATAAGAFALTENNLYTVEAFKDFAARLDDDGILCVTRWHLDPPDQLMRLASVARAMMAELGIGEAARRIVVVRGLPAPGETRAPATFLFKKDGFTDEEVRRLETVAAERAWELLYTPLTRPGSDLTRLIRAEDPGAVWDALPANVEPTRDNSPFFFNTVRFTRLGEILRLDREWRKTNLGTLVLLALLLLTSLLTAALILGPLAWWRGRVLADRSASALPWLLGFGGLGLGFILIEVVLVQKCILFLGQPTYSLTVVLFSLLAFSGLGSFLSRRVPASRLAASLTSSLTAVAVLACLAAAALSPLFYRLVHLPHSLRIVVTVLALAPLGLALGVPMPTAVRLLAGRRPEIIPWAWGVNGATSVTGSVAAVVIALAAGFDQALLVAAAAYGLSLLAFRRAGRVEGA